MTKELKATTVEKIEKDSDWELTEEEIESILLPTPEEYREKYRQDFIEYLKNEENMGITKKTWIGVIVNKKTGEIRYE